MNVTLKRMTVTELIVRKFGSLTNMAKEMGISRQTLYIRVSTGRCRFENAVKIADLLGVPVQDIYYEREVER